MVDLIVSLDVPTLEEAQHLVGATMPTVNFFKIGLQLFTRSGPALIENLAQRNARIFLDLKFHDIPNTVHEAVRSACSFPLQLLTLHASGGRGMLHAASEARRDSAVKLLAVTVLTSQSQSDLSQVGLSCTVEDQVLRLAELALDAGVDGLVCSPQEVSAIRKRFGNSPYLVTPGIRPAGAVAQDQKRAMTPGQAVAAGASALVVGRPIYEAPNPQEAAQDILNEMQSELFRV